MLASGLKLFEYIQTALPNSANHLIVYRFCFQSVKVVVKHFKKQVSIMRYLSGSLVLWAILAACAPVQPNDGDQYFDNITPDPASLERKAEEDKLAKAEGQKITTVLPPSGTTATSTQTGDTLTIDLSGNEKAPVKTTPEGDGSISDSQDFQAVKSRETIASDAAKLEALKSNYEIVQPGDAPTRDSSVNLAKYALSQTNPVGNKQYTRFAFSSRKAEKNCRVYTSADEAQTDFLKMGGPQKDKRGIDPDGDGYACGWSPAVYRALIGQ
jgi:hypothetical protein